MRAALRAFLTGMWEYRASFTVHYHEARLQRAYDRGRELAHRLTGRRFET